MINLKPNPDKVIALADPAKTKIGEFEVINFEEHQYIATVLRIGKNIDAYAENDRIIVGKNAGAKFEYNDVEYVLLSQQDIYATIENE